MMNTFSFIKKITRYAKAKAKVDPLTLLTHLWDTCRELNIADLQSNKTRMKAQWTPPPLSPIELIFLQLEEGQAFAKEGNEEIYASWL